MPAKSAFEELEMLIDKLGIDQFELDEEIGKVIDPMKSVIIQHQEQNQQKKSQISAFLTQKTEVDKQIFGIKLEIEKGQNRCEKIELLLSRCSNFGKTMVRSLI